MKFFFFFGAEAMILLVEIVVGIPIGEASRGGVPLIAENLDVFLIHFDRRRICQWQGPVLVGGLSFLGPQPVIGKSRN